MTLNYAEKKKECHGRLVVCAKNDQASMSVCPAQKNGACPLFFPPTYQAMSLGPFDDIT